MSVHRESVALGVVIPAAGRGTRSGESCPKSYRRIGGDSALNRVIRLYRSWNKECPIVIVHHADHAALLEASIYRGANVYTAVGGVERQESILRGLRFLSRMERSPSHVFIHCAARPFTTVRLLDSLLESLIQYPTMGVSPAIPVVDTLKRIDSNGFISTTVPRDGIFRGQTPQGFDLKTILELHEQAAIMGKLFTDDSCLFEDAGLPVRVVRGDLQNMKLTYYADLEEADRFLRGYRSPGMEFDVGVDHGCVTHEFAPGEEIPPLL
ncbi:hypothetical protein SI65_09366 [Aspergillus cristatus]|uniref:2-C-methyl-D-erythritol 4-phosphate cytidylyltransferase n=1 Tax=Aspergillus cristatus TaxID=573508 RepID=A0A1E3B2H1_ASPCR|nr:hypothetical protein SI65_09366 [Aspergillus cristatus]